MSRTTRILVGALALSGCTRSSQPATPAPPKPTAVASPSPSPSPAQALPVEVDRSSLATLLKAKQGRPLLVNVFASWCQPCKQELPDIDKLKKEHPRLAVLGIDVDDKPADEAHTLELKRFLASTVPASFEVVRSPAGTGAILPALKLPKDWNEAMPPGWERTVPLTFFYNSKGDFENGSLGQLSVEALAEMARLASAP